MKNLLLVLVCFTIPCTLASITKPVVFGIYDIYAAKYNTDAPMQYAIAEVESTHRVNAWNPSGASGLRQLMPKTAKWLCGLEKWELFDPHKNVDCGTRYYAYLKRMYGGSDVFALAAYHSGPTTVNDFRFGTNVSGKNPGRLKTGIPPWDVVYIRKIFRIRARYI